MPSPLFLNFKDILRISSSCLKLLFSVQVFVQYSSQLKISALSDERSQNWRIHKAGKILKAFLFSCWTSLGTISKRAKCCQTILLSRSSFLQNCWGFLSRVKQQTLLDRLTPKVWISYSSCQTLVNRPKIIFRMVVFNACANLYSRHMLNEKRCWTDWHQKSGFVFISLWISHSSCQTLVNQPQIILRVIFSLPVKISIPDICWLLDRLAPKVWLCLPLSQRLLFLRSGVASLGKMWFFLSGTFQGCGKNFAELFLAETRFLHIAESQFFEWRWRIGWYHHQWYVAKWWICWSWW